MTGWGKECEAGAGIYGSLFLSYLLVRFSYHEPRKGACILNGNEVPTSNTPIFDRLAAERGFHRLIQGGPIELHPIDRTPFQRVSGAPNGYASGWASEATTQATVEEEPEEIVIDEPTESIDVRTLFDMNQPPPVSELSDEFNAFISKTRRTFVEANPTAIVTGVTPKFNGDGSVTVVVEAIEPEPFDKERLSRILSKKATAPGVVMSEWVEEVTDAEKIRSGEMSANDLRQKHGIVDPPPKTSIGEDVANTLYMKSFVPKSLLISDEEIADEE